MAKTRRVEGQRGYQWISLASKFPPTLVRNRAPDMLEDGETYDAYGLNITREGQLWAGSLPTTAKSRPTWLVDDPTNDNTPFGLTIADYDWYYIYNRLWAIGDASHRGQNVYYFAYQYRDDLFTQGFSRLTATQGWGNVIGLLPFSGNIAIVKANSTLVIPNAMNPRGNFELGPLFQGFGASGMNDVTVHEGVLYCANTNGVFSFDGRNLRELTADINYDLDNFTDADLDGTNNSGIIIDKNTLRLVADDGTKKYVVDLSGERPRLFDYSTSGFRWRSKTLVSESLEPIAIRKFGLYLAHSDTNKGTFSYQVKLETEWQKEEDQVVPYTTDNTTRVDFDIPTATACRRWAMRITALSSNLRINEVQVFGKTYGIRGYSE